MKPIHHSRSIVIMALLMLCGQLTQGCNLTKTAVNQFAPALGKTKASFNRNTSLQFAREASPGLLALLDGLVDTSPENEELRLLQAELNATFAFGFLEHEYRIFKRSYQDRKATAHKAWVLDHYKKTRRAAEFVLDQQLSGASKKLESLAADKVEAWCEENFDSDDVPALFWIGFAWASSMNLNREQGAAALKAVPTVKALMRWIVKTDESYFNGGAHLVLAIFELSLGKSIGGRPEAGLKHIQAVERITRNKLLLTRVLKAEFYYPQVQTLTSTDGKPVSADARKAHSLKIWNEYLTTLESVMKSATELDPKFNLQNAVAKMRADDLYYRADDVLFQPAGARLPTRPGEDDYEAEDEESDEDE